MTAKEIFNKIRNASLKYEAFHIGAISERKYNELVKMLKAYVKDADMDYKLGVISQEEHQEELKRVNYMLLSMRTAETY